MFEIEKCKRICDNLFVLAVTETLPLPGVQWREGRLDSLDAPAATGALAPFPTGGEWGGRDVMAVFALECEVPASMAGRQVYFELTTGREGHWNATNPQFVAFANGRLRQGMDTNHTRILLADEAKGGERFNLVLEGWSGMEDARCRFAPALVAVDAPTLVLAWDLRVAADAVALLDKNGLDFVRGRDALLAAVNLLDFRCPFSASYTESVQAARAAMETGFFQALGGHPAAVHCIGHTHIDVAWQWRISHSRRKVVRSLATVLELMDRYPDYVFSTSQPALLQFVKEDAPDLYARIKQRVAEGRFEVEGSMWVEADCNLISGESMVRQLLYGKRFFKEEFAVDSRVLWLPDVFGYSAAMPQILRKSGVDSFVTSKISWNEYNHLPNDTFLWQGIDGSEVLTQFHTMPLENGGEGQEWFATYVGTIRPKTLAGAWNRYQNKDLSTEVLATYGYGDGGGGPNDTELEYGTRLTRGLPGVPRVQLGNARQFMDAMSWRARESKHLPRWVGELYLEFHRGTYTSMARNKRDNRRCEYGLQTVELLLAQASTQGVQAGPDKQQLDDTWREVLTLQFHDILPGSSIAEVYEDSQASYTRVLSNIGTWTQELCTALVQGGGADNFTVFNPSPFAQDAPVLCNPPADATAVVYNGETLPLQRLDDGRSVFVIPALPALGAAGCAFSAAAVAAPTMQARGARLLDNGILRVEIDDNGEIAGLYDHRAQRQLAAAPLNHLCLYEDKPPEYDAWDIPAYFRQKPYAVGPAASIRLAEDGPVRWVVEVERAFSLSTITHRYVLYAGSAQLDIQTRVDWRETQHLLKAAFPLDIAATHATYDIQFGNVQRPTHQNTSWDAARFEVCAHKWADLSENGYGVALLNDSKYGHSALGSTLELTLLKSPVFPSQAADREVHEFTYSLLPHPGRWDTASVNRAAHGLNRPAFAVPGRLPGGTLPALAVAACDSEAVILDTTKPAENRDGVILRLFEAEGRRAGAHLHFAKRPKSVHECDMLENDLAEAPLDENGRLALTARPYEVKTYRVRF